MSPDTVLFSSYILAEFLDSHCGSMFTEIDSIPEDEFLNTSVEDYCEYFEEKYKIDVPRLRSEEITVDRSETSIPRDDFGRSEFVPGTTVKFFVPFEGDAKLYECRPSVFTLAPPRADIRENTIVATYYLTDHDAIWVKSQFNELLSEIMSWLDRVKKDVSSFNSSIQELARNRIEARRKRLLADQGLVAALGFPLRERKDTPRTFIASEIQRKVAVPRPSGGKAPFVPEPALSVQDYEHILSVIHNMVSVMERSPKAFSGMKEEHLRDHFLVQLNGHYEGQATGETFNFEGKTDILIRVKDKNIFIAECKFWRGPKYLKNAIDQLLDYTSWRDTKTAILLFNRHRNFSELLAKIPEVIESHPNTKRRVNYNSETGFRFVIHHRHDVTREIILTVLAFEVPK
jgi:hypothetical protein